MTSPKMLAYVSLVSAVSVWLFRAISPLLFSDYQTPRYAGFSSRSAINAWASFFRSSGVNPALNSRKDSRYCSRGGCLSERTRGVRWIHRTCLNNSDQDLGTQAEGGDIPTEMFVGGAVQTPDGKEKILLPLRISYPIDGGAQYPVIPNARKAEAMAVDKYFKRLHGPRTFGGQRNVECLYRYVPPRSWIASCSVSASNSATTPRRRTAWAAHRSGSDWSI
jgi:hypothetical protein